MGHSHSRHLFPRRDKKHPLPLLDELPLLVLECVCQHLCWHCLTDYAPARRLSNDEEQVRRSGLESLYRLCLVSKNLHHVAQPILFHRFRGLRSSHVAKFTLVLQLRPDLALAVRTLQLELATLNEDMVLDLIHFLPALRSLELFHAPKSWTFNRLNGGSLPALELLSLKFSPLGLGERTPLLKAAPNLRDLVVSSCNPTLLPGSVPPMASVKRLVLSSCYPTSKDTGYRDYKSVVDLCEKLESFELVQGIAGHGRGSGPTAREVMTMLTSQWGSLRHLRLVGYGQDLEHHAGGDIEPISSLAEFPALATVEVPTVVVYGTGGKRHAIKRISTDLLPPSIDKLVLGWVWELDADILPFDLLDLTELIKGGRFPRLRRVELQSQTRKHVVRRIPGLDELERAFAGVGIVLVAV